jgi:hypothetical protein
LPTTQAHIHLQRQLRTRQLQQETSNLAKFTAQAGAQVAELVARNAKHHPHAKTRQNTTCCILVFSS